MVNILFGIVSGIVSGMGIGGGAILITLLTCFKNMDQKVAQGSNLLFFIPTAVIATIINIKYKRINYKQAIIVSVIGAIGAAIGAYISTKMETTILRKLFAIFLMIVAIYELTVWYKKFIKKNKK